MSSQSVQQELKELKAMFKLCRAKVPRLNNHTQRIEHLPRLPDIPKQTYKGWVNFYLDNSGTVYPGKIHLTQKQANHPMVDVCGRIACVYVEITEGQGIQTDK
jgi:hypothetical protein